MSILGNLNVHFVRLANQNRDAESTLILENKNDDRFANVQRSTLYLYKVFTTYAIPKQLLTGIIVFLPRLQTIADMGDKSLIWSYFTKNNNVKVTCTLCPNKKFFPFGGKRLSIPAFKKYT